MKETTMSTWKLNENISNLQEMAENQNEGDQMAKLRLILGPPPPKIRDWGLSADSSLTNRDVGNIIFHGNGNGYVEKKRKRERRGEKREGNGLPPTPKVDGGDGGRNCFFSFSL